MKRVWERVFLETPLYIIINWNFNWRRIDMMREKERGREGGRERGREHSRGIRGRMNEISVNY